MAEVDFKPVRAGFASNVDVILKTLGIDNLDRDTVLEFMFFKVKEGRTTTFFSHLNKEKTEEAVSHKDFMQIYRKFSLARKEQKEVLMQEAISAYKNLASPVEPAQRNP